MSNKPPTQLGAQRFYNAIKAGNVGFVAMYCTSLTNGNVQQFDPVKVYEAWEPTSNIEMLNVLLTTPTLRSFHRSYRYGSTNRGFGLNVIDKVNKLTFDNGDATNINTLRATVQAFEANHCKVPYDDLASTLAKHLSVDKTWPYATMAESQELSNILVGYNFEKEKTSIDVVDWYVEMFGVPKEMPKGNLRQSIIYLFQNKQWLQLEKLLPDMAFRQKVFKEYWNINNPIDQAVRGHQYYLELLRIAPWAKV